MPYKNYSDHLVHVKLLNKRYRNKRREYINRAKCKPCTDCGVQYNPWVMDFDHQRDKVIAVSQAFSRYSIKRIQQEIDKCDVVCSNCHRERTYKRFKEKK